jgi:hypothetical protein
MRLPMLSSTGGTLQAVLAIDTFSKRSLLAQEILAMVPRMPKKPEPVNPAERLVELLGGRPAVAAAFDVSSETVRLWLKHGIPEDRALDVEQRTKKLSDPITALQVLEWRRDQKAAA